MLLGFGQNRQPLAVAGAGGLVGTQLLRWVRTVENFPENTYFRKCSLAQLQAGLGIQAADEHWIIHCFRESPFRWPHRQSNPTPNDAVGST